MGKLTLAQLRVLDILKDGGKLFVFEDGSTGLDNAYGDCLYLSARTYDALIKKSCLALSERPCTGTEVYTINRIGLAYLTTLKPKQ